MLPRALLALPVLVLELLLPRKQTRRWCIEEHYGVCQKTNVARVHIYDNIGTLGRVWGVAYTCGRRTHYELDGDECDVYEKEWGVLHLECELRAPAP